MEIVVSKLIEIIMEFWVILGDMAPYLLLGFGVAGILYVYVPTSIIEKHLGGTGVLPTVKASIIGVPLPLCSCGVIPIAASLRQNKASRGATTSFLISAPQVGVGSVFVTLSLLGPIFAVIRPAVALISGIFGGILVNNFVKENNDSKIDNIDIAPSCNDSCCSSTDKNSNIEKTGKFTAALNYGFVDLPRDLGRALIIGLLIAGLLTALVPLDKLPEGIKTGILPMLLLMLLSMPIYICATACVPIAAALINGGISPGATLVFLVAGPAVNAITIAVVWKTMGTKTVFIYVMSVAIIAILSGLLLDYSVFQSIIAPDLEGQKLVPSWFNTISAVILIGLLINAMRKKPEAQPEAKLTELDFTDIQVSGIKCTHCQNVVAKAVIESVGVTDVRVDPHTGKIRVIGNEFDIDYIKKKITGLGYPVKD